MPIGDYCIPKRGDPDHLCIRNIGTFYYLHKLEKIKGPDNTLYDLGSPFYLESEGKLYKLEANPLRDVVIISIRLATQEMNNKNLERQI